MSETTHKALVFTILRHAEEFPWRMQDIGLLGLRLDERRECRLHVWDPAYMDGEPPVHDHPYDFTSTVVVGEMTNKRYVEAASGDEYRRYRYSVPAEDERRSDTVRLSMTEETFGEGEEYRQLAHELHASWQQPGTVTLIRCSWVKARELTVCLRDGEPWHSGQAREPTRQEVKAITSRALAWF